MSKCTKMLCLTIAAVSILALVSGVPFRGVFAKQSRGTEDRRAALWPELLRAPSDTEDAGSRISIVSAPSAAQADAENVELVGHIGGSSYAVAVQGNYAYIGEGPRLTILDISRPVSPTVVGKTPPLPDIVQDVCVIGSYAYIADGDAGLRVVDISNPFNPAVVGAYDAVVDATGVAVAGKYAYVAAAFGLRVLDVSDPFNPIEVSFHEMSLSFLEAVTVVGEYALVATFHKGLRIVDVSDPVNPVEVGFYDTPGNAVDLFAVGSYAYIADMNAGLRVVDISNPAKPVEVGFYDTRGQALGVAISEGIAYIADHTSGLRAVDVSNPVYPTEVGFCHLSFSSQNVAVAGSYAYVADGWSGGMHVVDVSTPSNPTEVGVYEVGASLNGVAVAGNYAYVAENYTNGLRVMDVSTPTNPVQVGFCDDTGMVEGVAVAGNYAYLATNYGLVVVDVSDPANPIDYGWCKAPSSAHDVAVAGSYVYLVTWDAGLRVIDVSDPFNPVEVGFCDTPGEGNRVALAGSYAYVADSSGGLRVVDISDPTNPTEVGYYTAGTPGRAYDVAVAGNYAYVAYGWKGLRVVDVSDPVNPMEVGVHETLNAAISVAVAGGHLYLGDSQRLRILDVSTPSDPTEVGFFETPGSVDGIAVDGNIAYVADYEGGLFILRYTTLAYASSRYLLPSEMLLGEADNKISMGDHARLELRFRNKTDTTISGTTVQIDAPETEGQRPGVLLAQLPSDAPSRHLELTLPSIGSGDTGHVRFWIYVENVDADVRMNPNGAGMTWLRIHGEKLDSVNLWIRLSPIVFSPVQYTDLAKDDCLHTPSNPRIQAYAQYAAGTECELGGWLFEPADPDTPEQAIRNLVRHISQDFDFDENNSEERVPDTVLLLRRNGLIGKCRHFTDLTAGLLRSLGFPSRCTTAVFTKHGPFWFDETVGHTWVEAYLGAGGWRQVDSTWDTTFEEGVYEDRGCTVEEAWADRFPLSSASRLADKEYRCIPSCYETPVDCANCSRESNTSRWLWPWEDPELSCVDDVRGRYHNTTAVQAVDTSVNDAELLIYFQNPTLITRTVPFTLTAGIVNSTTLSLNTITATVATSEYADSTVPLFDVKPSYHLVNDMNPGQVVTVTWVVTPLVTGPGVPLRLAVFNDNIFSFKEQPLVVKEPGAPPPLILGSYCGPGTIQPGQPLTLTAYLLGETLKPLTDTLASVTASLCATPTLGYSATVSLTLDADGFFRQSLTLPIDGPIGTYLVDFTAARPGYESAQAISTFFVAPALTVTLEVVPSVVNRSELLILRTQVYERETAVNEASVRAEVATPNGAVTVPLAYGDGVYTAAFCPTDLAPSLGGEIRGGHWQITVIADYCGGNSTTTKTVTVFREVYLPLILHSN